MLKKLNEKVCKFNRSKYGRVVVIGGALLSASAARAEDGIASFTSTLTTSATGLVTSLSSVAGAALPILVLILGIRYGIRLFNSVAQGGGK